MQRDGATWAPTLQHLCFATHQLNKCHLPSIESVCHLVLCSRVCIPAGLRADWGLCWPIVSTEDGWHNTVGKNHDKRGFPCSLSPASSLGIKWQNDNIPQARNCGAGKLVMAYLCEVKPLALALWLFHDLSSVRTARYHAPN